MFTIVCFIKKFSKTKMFFMNYIESFNVLHEQNNKNQAAISQILVTIIASKKSGRSRTSDS